MVNQSSRKLLQRQQLNLSLKGQVTEKDDTLQAIINIILRKKDRKKSDFDRKVGR